MKKTITCVFLAIICLMMGGCGKGAPSYFAYREKDFCAEVRGRIGEIEFAATVRMQRMAEGMEALEVRYGAPGALEGMTVSVLRDGEGVLRSASVSAGEGMTVPIEGEAVRGWLRPLLCLMEPTEFSTVQKKGEEYVLAFADGARLTLAPREEGLFPTAFSSEKTSFTVLLTEKSTAFVVEVHKKSKTVG